MAEMAKSIEDVLKRIDGRRYGAYKELLGARSVIRGIRIEVVKVQGDPYARPSVARLEARIDAPEWALCEPVALADWLYRRFHRALARLRARMGEGHSGFLGVPEPGPVMIRRSGLEVKGDRVVARAWVGLPSRRRRVLADAAEELLLRRLPEALRRALEWRRDEAELRRHVDAWVEQEYIRSKLPGLGLVSFVGDGSVLPRKHGGSQEPLEGAVPFESPPSMRVEIDLPTGRTVSGMGVPRGVTVIAGQAFHGKTTLLEAIAAGVYNHVPGDGRELVVTVRNAVVVWSEEGRFVSSVDVSPFIHDLPGGARTEEFTTSDASGATSAAASIQEAVEAGSQLILMDEDTVATNILYLDERAAKLTTRRTVTTIAELADSMKEHGLSLIIVSSGSLPLLAAADKVIVMEDYKPRDATDEARRLAEQHGVKPLRADYKPPRPRRLAYAPRLRKPKIRGGRLEDRELPAPVNLAANPMLVERAQLNTLREVAKLLPRMKGKEIAWIARWVEETIRLEGFEALLGREPGPDLAEVRAQDVAFLINRLAGLKAVQAR